MMLNSTEHSISCHSIAHAPDYMYVDAVFPLNTFHSIQAPVVNNLNLNVATLFFLLLMAAQAHLC